MSTFNNIFDQFTTHPFLKWEANLRHAYFKSSVNIDGIQFKLLKKKRGVKPNILFFN